MSPLPSPIWPVAFGAAANRVEMVISTTRSIDERILSKAGFRTTKHDYHFLLETITAPCSSIRQTPAPILETHSLDQDILAPLALIRPLLS